MANPAEAGLLELEAGLTRVGVSLPAKAEIASAAPYSVGEGVIKCLLVEALDLLGLGAVDVPGPVFGADVSEIPGGIVVGTICPKKRYYLGHDV